MISWLDVIRGLVGPEELRFPTLPCPYGPHWHDAKDAMVNALMMETCQREQATGVFYVHYGLRGL